MAQLPLRRPGPGAALPCWALVGVLGSRAWGEPHWHTGDPNPGGGSEKGGAWWSHEKPLSVGTAFTSTGNSWSKPVMSLGLQLASLPSPCPLPVWLCPPWRPQVRSPDRPQASLSRTGKAASSQQRRGPPRSGTPVPDLHLLYATSWASCCSCPPTFGLCTGHSHCLTLFPRELTAAPSSPSRLCSISASQ